MSGALLIAPSGAGAAVTYGISDQQATTFTNPLYAPLKLKTTRYITSYDVMDVPAQRANLVSYLVAARSAKQKVLLSVEHSRVPGKEGHVPSNSEYKAAIKKIKAAFNSQIETFSPWNEVNVRQAAGRTEGQPTRIANGKTGPKIVAGYYKTAKSVFKGKKILGLDVLDGASASLVGGTKAYIRRFRAAGGSTNKYWGLHNYSDTNRYGDKLKRTKSIISAFGSGQVWLTETGGQVKSRSFKYDEARAAKAIGCTITIAKRYSKIKRVYFYQFNGAAPAAEFDGGLIGPDGATKRKGYVEVQKRKSYNCKK